MAFSKEDILGEFEDANYLGSGSRNYAPRDQYDIVFLLQKHRKLAQRRAFAKWVAKGNNKFRKKEWNDRWRAANRAYIRERQKLYMRAKGGYKARVPKVPRIPGAPKHKLTWEKVEEIRKLYSGVVRNPGDRHQPNKTYLAIGKKYGVGITAVYKVLNYKSWKQSSREPSMALISAQSKES